MTCFRSGLGPSKGERGSVLIAAAAPRPRPLRGNPGIAAEPPPTSRPIRKPGRAALSILACLILCVLDLACVHHHSGSRSPASLILSFGSAGAKSFAPAGLDIASVRVQGTGPSGLRASALSPEASPVELEVAPGRWSFAATALSSSGIEVAAGLLELDLDSGERATGTVVLLPVQGTGTVVLSWSLAGELSGVLRVEGALSGPGGAALPVSAAFAEGPLRFQDIASGEWRLELRLTQDGSPRCGLAACVLVAAGMETLAPVAFDPPLARLGLELAVPDFGAAALELRPSVRRVRAGGQAGFEAVGVQTAAWYLEGSALGGEGPAICIAAPADPGSVKVDCLASGASGRGRDARASIVAGDPRSVGPIRWLETVVKEEAEVPSRLPAGLGACRDLAFSPDGALLAAASKEANAVSLFGFSPSGSPFARATALAAGSSMAAPTRLRFRDCGSLLAISDSEGALYALTIAAGALASGGIGPTGLAVVGQLRDALLAGAADLAIPADGASAYVAAASADAVSLVGLGAGGEPLSIVAAAAKGAGELAAFSRPTCLALSPDGSTLAVGTSGDDALYIFSRNGADGSLSLAERIDKSAFASLAALSDPCSAAFAASGASLYLLSYYGKALFRLDRDPITGHFSPSAAARSGEGGVSGFAYPKRLALAPGREMAVVAGGGASDGLALFDLSSGELAFMGALLPPGGDAVLSRPAALAVAPTGSTLAAANDGRLAIFGLDPAP